ncbi:MAG: DUF4493 domain-containing protein [Mangrovibacterium sp.]
MKSKIQLSFQMILCLALGIFINSCAKYEGGSTLDQFKGTLKLHVNLSLSAYESSHETKAGVYNDFQVRIFKKNEQTPIMTFEHSSEIPDLIELAEGEYYVTAACGGNPAAAFESPYYYGESELFTIADGQTAVVNVTCTLANIMVTIVYSENVISYFDDYNTTVSNPTGNLLFTKDESRAGFFNTGPLLVECQLDYATGEGTKTLTKNISPAQKGKHYEIRVNTTPDGEFDISFNVDENVETIVVDLTDEEESVPGEADPGELLITEIMYNPKAMADADGEWIELFNNSNEVINLKDLVFRKGGATSFHKIASDVVLDPGDYAVLAKEESATTNVDYVCSAISLPQNGDELIISTFGTNGTDGTVICSVDYVAEGFVSTPEGKSLQLDPSVRDVNAARLGSNWCASTPQYSTGDYGTPGEQNPACE